MTQADPKLPVDGMIGFDTANGGRLTLKFGTRAMVAVERRLDAPITELVDKMQKGGVRLEHLVVMFHCALLHQDQTLTEDRAADLMDEIGPAKAVDLVGLAFQAAFPQDGDVEAGPEATADPPAPPKPKGKAKK